MKDAGRASALVSFVTRNVELGALVYGNRRLAQKLLDEGHRTDFVAVETVHEDARASLPAGITTIALGCRRFRQAPLRLARYYRERRPVAVFASGYIEGLCCVLAAKMVRDPPRIIVRSHVVSSIYLRIQPKFVDRRLFRYFMRWLFRPPVRVVAVSDDGARDFEQLLNYREGSVSTLYDAVLPEANRTAGRLAHPWLEEKETRLLLSVGRLEPQKDFETLIRAFARVHAKDRSARLLILGEGSERPRLDRLVAELGLQEVVDLPGYVGDPETAYRKADLFICSSAYEGLCNVIIEALAAGCRVVSTDCPVGPAEVLERGRQGQLVPVGDVEALGDAMLRAPSLPFDKEAALKRAMDFHVDRVWPQFAELAGLSLSQGADRSIGEG